MQQLLRRWWHLSPVEPDLDLVCQAHPQQEVAPEELGISAKGAAKIWQAVENLYRTGTQPGISFCLRRRGQILFNRSLGYASGNGPEDRLWDEKRLMTPDTPVCIFSASKAVTALLMHKLAEQGVIDLLDPVSYYLPEFAANGKRNITIHQILSHRGGIPGLPTKVSPDTLYNPDEVWRLLCAAKPIAADGAHLAYHAITGGFVMARVLEKVTGDSIQNFLDRHIRQPMGMTHFTYGIDEAYAPRVARNYFTGPKPPFPINRIVQRALGVSMERAAEVTNDQRWRAAVVPAGNIYATAEEVSRFFQMMLNGGEWQGQQLFEPITIQRAVHEYGSLRLDRSLYLPMRYSAGFMLGGDPVGLWGQWTGRAYGHVGLINKFCWADPAREISVSLLTTGLPLVSHHLPSLVKVLMQINRYCTRTSGAKR